MPANPPAHSLCLSTTTPVGASKNFVRQSAFMLSRAFHDFRFSVTLLSLLSLSCFSRVVGFVLVILFSCVLEEAGSAKPVAAVKIKTQTCFICRVSPFVPVWRPFSIAGTTYVKTPRR